MNTYFFLQTRKEKYFKSHYRQLGTLPSCPYPIDSILSNLFIKNISTGVNLPQDYPNPLHVTSQKCPPSMINICIHHVHHVLYVKTGRTATLHTTLSPARLATGLCRSPTSPPSPGRPTPSTPALHRFHQFED